MSQQSVNPYLRNNYNQIGFSSQTTNPAMQGQTTANEVVQSTGAGQLSNRLKASKDADPLTTLGLTLGIGYGIGQGMDVYNRNFNKEYSQTITGKVGNWVDKFFENNSVGKYIESKLKAFDNWTNQKAQTSKIVRSLKYHSTEAQWKFAKFFTLGIKGFLGADTEQVVEGFIEKPIGLDFQKLEQYRIPQSEIDSFKAACTGTKAEKLMALQIRELEALGQNKQALAGKSLEELQTLAKELKSKKIGFNDFAHYSTFKGKFGEKAEEMAKILEKSDKNIIITRLKGAGNTIGGRIRSHFIGREVGLQELSNKFNVILGKNNKTYFGRAIPKAMAWITEGCTNRFAGGKFVPLMQATIFADMLYHIWNAPKGEKIQTGAERLVNDFFIFIGGIIGAIGMHKIGGFKYLGVDNAGKEAYRQALKLHNENVVNKVFNNKKEFKDSLKAVNKLLKRKDLNFLQKGLAKLGELINCGNEHSFAYRSKSAVNMNWLRRIANTNILGAPMRFIIPMFIVGPFIGKIATKMVHAVIGRPTVSVLDEENEEETQQPQAVQPKQNQQTTPQVDPNKLADSNLIKQTVAGEKARPEAQTQTQNPQNNNQQNQDGKILEPVRTYIPSPVGMVQNYDPTAAQMALNNADASEKKIQEILGKMK